MAVPIVLYSGFILGAVVLVFVVGCFLYMLRRYCLSRCNNKKGVEASGNRSRDDSSSDEANRADDRGGALKNGGKSKIQTFDQILRKEERSGYSLEQLRLPKIPAGPNRQTKSNSR